VAHTLCALTIFCICSFFTSKSPNKFPPQCCAAHVPPVPSSHYHLRDVYPFIPGGGWCSGQSLMGVKGQTRHPYLPHPRVGGSNRGSNKRERERENWAPRQRVSEWGQKMSEIERRECENERTSWGKRFHVKGFAWCDLGRPPGRSQSSSAIMTSAEAASAAAMVVKKKRKSQWVQEVVQFMWSITRSKG